MDRISCPCSHPPRPFYILLQSFSFGLFLLSPHSSPYYYYYYYDAYERNADMFTTPIANQLILNRGSLFSFLPPSPDSIPHGRLLLLCDVTDVIILASQAVSRV